MTSSERAAQIWPLLTFCASMRRLMTYGELAKLIGASPRSIGAYLDPIHHYCLQRRLPPLTSLVVKNDTGAPGVGFQLAADVPRAQARTFAFDWTTCELPEPSALEEARLQARTGSFRCPIPGCPKVFYVSRGGWDAHVASHRTHPDWHPEVLDPEERKRLFKETYARWFR